MNHMAREIVDRTLILNTAKLNFIPCNLIVPPSTVSCDPVIFKSRVKSMPQPYWLLPKKQQVKIIKSYDLASEKALFLCLFSYLF